MLNKSKFIILKMFPKIEKNNYIAWICSLTIAVFIFYMSSLTSQQIPRGGSGASAYLYHVTVFFFLAFFLAAALVKEKNKKLLLLSVAISIIYALSDEIHQSFVTGRNSSLKDVFLDFIGISFASLVYLISLEYRKRITKPLLILNNII